LYLHGILYNVHYFDWQTIIVTGILENRNEEEMLKNKIQQIEDREKSFTQAGIA